MTFICSTTHTPCTPRPSWQPLQQPSRSRAAYRTGGPGHIYQLIWVNVNTMVAPNWPSKEEFVACMVQRWNINFVTLRAGPNNHGGDEFVQHMVQSRRCIIVALKGVLTLLSRVECALPMVQRWNFVATRGAPIKLSGWSLYHTWSKEET